MSFLRLKAFAKDVLPPIALRALRRFGAQGSSADTPEQVMDAFYGSLITPRSLCFDIGSNVGTRLASFRRLGFRVVAVEPQPECFSLLQSSFEADRDVTLVKKAVGSAPGTAPMMLSNANTVSTLSQEFIDSTTETGRFEGITWGRTITVEVVTLDQLIAEHGVPDFVKVDVEGFELEVIRGLSRPIGLVSLEWAPEMTDSILNCVAHLAQLGPVECNLSWGESMKLARRQWMSKEALIETLRLLRDDVYLWGDVYVRSAAAA